MKDYLIACFLALSLMGCENDYHLTRIECPSKLIHCPPETTDGGEVDPPTISVIPDDEIIIDIIPPEPDIELEPQDYDFGDIVSGCEQLKTVKIKNVGGADLIINQIFYSATSDLWLDDTHLGLSLIHI